MQPSRCRLGLCNRRITGKRVTLLQGTCKVAVVSTYPPKQCGVATFTAALLARMRTASALPEDCEIGVFALSDPSDALVYTDPIVHYDLRLDSVRPCLAPSCNLPSLKCHRRLRKNVLAL